MPVIKKIFVCMLFIFMGMGLMYYLTNMNREASGDFAPASASLQRQAVSNEPEINHSFVNCKKVTSEGICMDIPMPVIKITDHKNRVIFESKCAIFSKDGESCEKWEYLRDYTYQDDKLVKTGYGRFITSEGYFQDYVVNDLVYDYTMSKQCGGAYSDGTCIPFGEKYNTGVFVNIHFKNKEGQIEWRYCEERHIRPDGTCNIYQSGSVANSKNRPEAYRTCARFDANGQNCLKYERVDFIKRDAVNNKNAQLRCKAETISDDGDSCSEYAMSWWDYAYESASPHSRATAFKICPEGSKIKEDGSCRNYTCSVYKYENNVQTSESIPCSKAESLIKKYKSELAAAKRK
jgi:hypothetical protein